MLWSQFILFFKLKAETCNCHPSLQILKKRCNIAPKEKVASVAHCYCNASGIHLNESSQQIKNGTTNSTTKWSSNSYCIMQYWSRDTNGFGGIYCCCPESRIQGILDSIVTNDSCESRTEQSKWSSESLVASTIFRSSKSPGGRPQDMLALKTRAPGG